MGLQRWWEQEIPVDGTINRGELMTHNLTELIKPESYEVRLTPITRFGEGDSAIRIVTYSGECYTVLILPFFLGFCPLLTRVFVQAETIAIAGYPLANTL